MAKSLAHIPNRGPNLTKDQEQTQSKNSLERAPTFCVNKSQSGENYQGDIHKYGFRLKSEEVIFRQD